MRYHNVCIESLEYVLPDIEVPTTDIEASIAPLYGKLGLKPGWLQAVTGIRARRFWERGWKPSDVATLAAEKALANTPLKREEIQALISCSVCKDYIEPSVAAIVHGKLGLPTTAHNYDVGNACLGFLSGMTILADQIELGRIEAGIIVSGESSRAPTEATIKRLQDPSADISDFKDNLATLTLGSAGIAMVMTNRRKSSTGHRFLGGLSRAATQWHGLCVGTSTKMTTNPTKLLSEGVGLAQRTWADMENVLNIRPNAVKEFALHQVGQANHDAVLQALKIPPNRAIRLYIDHGNIGSCGVPFALAALVEKQRLQKGDRAALMGIGSGLNVMMLGVEW
jgi:3-oxoacyl-[acyl-carrier-protein] synthase-3